MALESPTDDLANLAGILSSIVEDTRETSELSAMEHGIIRDIFSSIEATLATIADSSASKAALDSMHGDIIRYHCSLAKACIHRIRPYHQAGGASPRQHSLLVFFRKFWWALFPKQHAMKIHLKTLVFFGRLSQAPGFEASTQITTHVDYRRDHGIEIVDFGNQAFVVPGELCYSLDKLHLVIQSYYQHQPGRMQVELGDYTLFCEDLGDLQVDLECNFELVHKGMRLVMAALTWRTSDEGRLSGYECTRCRCVVSVDHIRESGCVGCPGCGRKSYFTMCGTGGRPRKRTYGYKYTWYGYPQYYVNSSSTFDTVHVVVEESCTIQNETDLSTLMRGSFQQPFGNLTESEEDKRLENEFMEKIRQRSQAQERGEEVGDLEPQFAF